MYRKALLIAALIAAGLFQPTAANDAPRYQWRKSHDADGIGKFFMGREIAQIMGPGGIVWLERPERMDQERPELLINALQIMGGETIADLGAGSGYYTFMLADAVGPKGSVLAVDIEPKMLSFIKRRAAKENRFNIGLIQSTETNPKLPYGRVDLVLMVDVYHELAFPIETMREVRHALKPKGRLALVEYRAEDPAVMIKPLHKMSEAQIVNELKVLGFKHLETINSLPLQHIVIFGKK